MSHNDGAATVGSLGHVSTRGTPSTSAAREGKDGTPSDSGEARVSQAKHAFPLSSTVNSHQCTAPRRALPGDRYSCSSRLGPPFSSCPPNHPVPYAAVFVSTGSGTHRGTDY